MLTWRYATPEEFLPVCSMFTKAGLGNSYMDIKRRITAPLALRQLITFYDNSKLCGFVTFAFMSESAEDHMPTTGIQPSDWRSGKNFWVVDFASFGHGYAMLRKVTKALGVKRARYFKFKHKQIREVRCPRS